MFHVNAAPSFSLTTPRYNMDTFSGRLRHWAAALNPFLLAENEASLHRAQRMLKEFTHPTSPASLQLGQQLNPTNADLWSARLAVENCVHPTSKEVIHPLFRMSMFLPMNFMILPIMMAPSTLGSFYRTAGIQWFNQSYNSAVNYANRSSDKQPTSEIAKAYTATCVVAVGGSLAASAWIKKLPVGSLKATVIRAVGPFLAVAGAATANLAFMRQNEWRSTGVGLSVKDEDGEVRGTSVIAGKDSLYKCCLARILWNLPCMVLPVVCAIPLRTYVPMARRNPYLTEVLLQMLGLIVGVPPALAAFNVYQTLPASQMEPSFHGLLRKNGLPVKELTYYKGL